MPSSPDPPPLVGASPAIAGLLEQVRRLAPLTRPVLLIGERGTGKELVAARLHYLSPRWAAPLVTVNCGAIAESLLESELFGHEAGAFTGAQRRRIGRFEAADGGTLFLDEVADASLAVQQKLLRAVEYGEIERVGGTGVVRVDARVVAATNVDLPARAAEGRFRPDLLDRLAFEVLTLPPLRARTGDIALLAEGFGRAMAAELGWPVFPGFTAGARARLDGHGWPGNVRELRNCVERAVARHGDPMAPIDLVAIDPFESPWRPVTVTAAAAATPAAGDLRATQKARERASLEAALAAAGSGAEAARRLGLGYHQFRRLLAKHGLGRR
jgi:psp operon transcriptional activator